MLGHSNKIPCFPVQGRGLEGPCIMTESSVSTRDEFGPLLVLILLDSIKNSKGYLHTFYFLLIKLFELICDIKLLISVILCI